jgi:hypothetical protein
MSAAELHELVDDCRAAGDRVSHRTFRLSCPGRANGTPCIGLYTHGSPCARARRVLHAGLRPSHAACCVLNAARCMGVLEQVGEAQALNTLALVSFDEVCSSRRHATRA